MTDQMRVFDRALVARRRARAVARVDRVAPILDDAADRLLDRLDDTTRRFTRALDLGGRGFVAAGSQWQPMRNFCPSRRALLT